MNLLCLVHTGLLVTCTHGTCTESCTHTALRYHVTLKKLNNCDEGDLGSGWPKHPKPRPPCHTAALTGSASRRLIGPRTVRFVPAIQRVISCFATAGETTRTTQVEALCMRENRAGAFQRAPHKHHLLGEWIKISWEGSGRSVELL